MKVEGGIVVTDPKVQQDGRVRIPNGSCDRHGLTVGDWIDATVVKDHEQRIVLGETKLDERNRIRIRSEITTEHDLIGEYVDIVFDPIDEPEHER